MGVFDEIAAGLGGKPPATSSGTLNKKGYDSRPMDDLRQSRATEMAKMGLNPDGSKMKTPTVPVGYGR